MWFGLPFVGSDYSLPPEIDKYKKVSAPQLVDDPGVDVSQSLGLDGNVRIKSATLEPSLGRFGRPPLSGSPLATTDEYLSRHAHLGGLVWATTRELDRVPVH